MFTPKVVLPRIREYDPRETAPASAHLWRSEPILMLSKELVSAYVAGTCNLLVYDEESDDRSERPETSPKIRGMQQLERKSQSALRPLRHALFKFKIEDAKRNTRRNNGPSGGIRQQPK